MDEAQEILLSSLESSGISLPAGVRSIKDLDPATLVSICSQSLRLIDVSYLPLPALLPDPMAERVKVCTDIASAMRSAGYRGDLSFHQFLYPSIEDSHKLVRFLVERLSESSGIRKITAQKVTGSSSKKDFSSTVSASEVISRELAQRNKVVEPCGTCFDTTQFDTFAHVVQEQTDITTSGSLAVPVPTKVNNFCSEHNLESSLSKKLTFIDHKNPNYEGSIAELERKMASLWEHSSKIGDELNNLRCKKKILLVEMDGKASEVEQLEVELDILKTATKMASDDQNPIDFYIGDLDKQVETRKQNLLEQESQWGALTQSSSEGKMHHVRVMHDRMPGMQEKLNWLKEVELETEAIIFEIQKREKEHSDLLAELERLPKIPSRKSYIQRIVESAKNSWKQDADIEKIINDTRELQKESNSIQERLHRTYAVVGETIFRDMKNDPVRRQAYQLLNSIHDSFRQISEKILAMDRVQRESADQEAKLASFTIRSFDVTKLQADLDAIRKENEFLEQQQQS